MIRAATEADFSDMLALYRHLVPSDPNGEDQPALHQHWQALVQRQGVTVFVYSHAARLVSTCTSIVVPNVMRAGRPYCYVENVVTHPDYRRKGFARATLSHAVEHALTEDCYKVLLVASPRNRPASALYESVGFRPERTGFRIDNR